MTEIRNVGSLNYTNQNLPPTKTESKEAEVKPPVDQVTISKPEKTTAQKIIEFPGKVVEGVAGTAVGLVSAPLHVLPGAIKGLHDGISHRHRGEGGILLPLFAQNIAAGAGIGFAVGGPLGAAIGGGTGLVSSILMAWIGDKTQVYDKLADHIDKKVDKAIEDNKGTKTEVAFQSATEGAIIGGVSGLRGGWHIGFETGKGVVSGVVAAAEGIAEGVYEAGKNIITGNK